MTMSKSLRFVSIFMAFMILISSSPKAEAITLEEGLVQCGQKLFTGATAAAIGGLVGTAIGVTAANSTDDYLEAQEGARYRQRNSFNPITLAIAFGVGVGVVSTLYVLVN